jgi:hypothetical protein
VKVFGGSDAHFVAVINTFGAARADELCVDPVHNVVLMANDAESPWPFVSFLNANNYTLAAHLIFNGTVQNGGGLAAPMATNGIEQCVWRAFDQNFYINIPEVNGPGDDSVNGAVVVLNPTTHQVVRIIDVDADTCAGPQGLALGPNGPNQQLLLGCNAPSSVNGGTLNGPQNAQIINADNGANIQILSDLGGADEVWIEPVSGHYYLAGGSHLPSEQVGVVDSNTEGTGEIDQQPVQGQPQALTQQAIFIGFIGNTTRRAHSVAGWSGTVNPAPGALMLAMVPIPAIGPAVTGPGMAPFSSVICDPIETSGCIAFFESRGSATEIDE